MAAFMCPEKKVFEIGDGVNHEVELVHNLGRRDISVQVFDEEGHVRMVALTFVDANTLRIDNSVLDLEPPYVRSAPIPRGWKVVIFG